MTSTLPRGLYGMVDLDAADSARGVALLKALLDGGAAIVQLRMKRAGAAELLAMAELLRPLCEGRARFIINDRLDVALAARADGVHLGQDDLPLGAARPLCPPGFLVGVSTHNEAEATAAAAGGADYIGFGPIFETRTKEKPDPVVGTARLRAVCRSVTIPVIAIGGIGIFEAEVVAAAGAHGAAIIAAVNGASDVAEAARRVEAAFR